IAPAAATRGAEGEPIAGRQLHAGRLQQLLLGTVIANEHGFVHRATLAAAQTPGRVLRALVVHVGDTCLQRAIGQIDAEPAAMPAGAAGIRAQRKALDQERILDLLQLDRRAAHVALADRDRRGLAVLVWPPAPAATEDVHQQETPAIGTEAADRAAAPVTLVRGP